MDLLARSQLQKAGKLLMDVADRTPPEEPRKEDCPTWLGLSDRAKAGYSISRAIRATFDSISRHVMKEGEPVRCAELEYSAQICARLGTAPIPGRFHVPLDILTRDISAAAVPNLISDSENVSFIDVLRKRTLMIKLGAQVISGLRGQTSVPSQITAASPTFLANEASTITETTPSFVQITLSPKNVGAYTEISRQLRLQSEPAVDALVTRDLANTVAVAIDYGVLAGTGSAGEPSGLLGAASPNLGSFSGASFSYDLALEAQSDVLTANAMIDTSTCGYITSTAIAKTLANRQRFTNSDSPLWEGNLAQGTLAGFPAYTTEQCPSGILLFGDFSQILIGEWGRLEILINPFTNFQAGIAGVRAIYSFDCGIRHARSFSFASPNVT